MTTEKIILRDLGGGLVLRHGISEDADEIAAFNAYVFRNSETQEPYERAAAWTRDLFNNHHTVHPADFTVVEDTNTHKVVSSFVWISQQWTYGGVPFGVGRPELVGTHPDYRGRGLVRAQFSVAHEWSAQRGELMQVITGIPYFYRQFGYEMTLQLGSGRAGYKPQVPKLKKDQEEPYRLRRATQDDLAFIKQLYAQRAKRNWIDCQRDDAVWRYELDRKSDKNLMRYEFRIIETPQGAPVGLLAHIGWQWGAALAAVIYEIIPGLSWVDVTPSVIRYLWATGESYAERDKKEPMGQFNFEVGGEHPVYSAMKDHLPDKWDGYAWYMRVPDIVAFLRVITLALEHNLAESVICGYTGELKINFYRRSVRLVFDHGRITEVAEWMPTPDDGGHAAFPGLTFLQLLSGWRSLEELRYEFRDCYVEGNTYRALLSALFPKRDSNVWPIS